MQTEAETMNSSYFRFHKPTFEIMPKTIVLLIITFLSFACTPTSKEKKDILLSHEVIKLPETIIGNAYSIQKVHHFLIVLDYSADSFFHLIDLKNKAYKGMYGNRGQAPNDFIHPGKLHPFCNNQLCTFDSSRGEIKLLTIHAENETIDCSTYLSVKQNHAFEIIPVGKDVLLTNGAFEQSMFQLCSFQNDILSISDEYPYKDEKEHKLSNQLRAMAYQGILSMNGQKKFAYATSNALQIHFYQIKDNQLDKLTEIIESYAQYIPNGNTTGYSVLNDGNSPECFTDLATTDNHVYALYSGRTFNKYKLSFRESKSLFVYDWNGKLIKTYHLDIPIVCFCIDEKEQKIYAIANLPDPALVIFSL